MRLGVTVWNDWANQLDPTLPASQVAYRKRGPDNPEGSKGFVDHRGLFGPDVLERIAFCLEVGQNVAVNHAEAEARYKAALDHSGPENAPFALARCSQLGWAGIAADPAHACRLYKAFAEGDDDYAYKDADCDNRCLATLCLAVCYERGIGTRKNATKAAALFEEGKSHSWGFELADAAIARLRQ